MISGLEKGLLDVEDTIDVENRHNVDGIIFEQVFVVLVIMKVSMDELKQDVEGHLDSDGFTSVMSTCDKNGRPIFGWLFT